MSTYETVIGLEVHVQLNTRSKAFCGDATRFGGEPNTQVSPVSLGHPGTLPRLNARQVEYAVKLGLALNSRINPESRFDRKNYFYADLPKGYQITQDAEPICRGGYLPIVLDDQHRQIRIHHIHMEEDAGKSMHDDDPMHSLIDLNRAGVPLLEIVTEPDLHSPEEVDAFMTAMRQLVRYLEISDGNMEQGSMRCDVNVSVRPAGAEKLGERCEIKNVNSMRFARRAIEYEQRRQIELLRAGRSVQQQTLNFDPETGVTSPLRDKEEAHDYRYFPEPDLPPVPITAGVLERFRSEMPELPWEARERLSTQYGLPEYDLQLLSEEKAPLEFFESVAQHCRHYKAIANLLINKVLPFLKEKGMPPAAFPVDAARLAAFVEMIEGGTVAGAKAYQYILPVLIEHPQRQPIDLARELNLLQNSDADQLGAEIESILAKHPDKVERYRKGKKGLIGFFIGELMKATGGKADAKVAQQLLRERLEQ